MSWNGGTSIYRWDFPWNKPSSYWGIPISGSPHFDLCSIRGRQLLFGLLNLLCHTWHDDPWVSTDCRGDAEIRWPIKTVMTADKIFLPDRNGPFWRYSNCWRVLKKMGKMICTLSWRCESARSLWCFSYYDRASYSKYLQISPKSIIIFRNYHWSAWKTIRRSNWLPTWQPQKSSDNWTMAVASKGPSSPGLSSAIPQWPLDLLWPKNDLRRIYSKMVKHGQMSGKKRNSWSCRKWKFPPLQPLHTSSLEVTTLAKVHWWCLHLWLGWGSPHGFIWPCLSIMYDIYIYVYIFIYIYIFIFI